MIPSIEGQYSRFILSFRLILCVALCRNFQQHLGLKLRYQNLPMSAIDETLLESFNCLLVLYTINIATHWFVVVVALRV